MLKLTEEDKRYQKQIFRYADQVSHGDEVLVNENNDLIPVKIISVSNFTLQGKHYLQMIFISLCFLILQYLLNSYQSASPK